MKFKLWSEEDDLWNFGNKLIDIDLVDDVKFIE